MKIKPISILSSSMFLAFILGLCCIDQGHNWSDDFALYVSQCQALLTGTTADLLEKNRFAMEHSYAHVGPYLYPSGFPILLAPIYSLLGLNLWAMKIYCLLFFVGSLPLIYLIFRSIEQDSYKALVITLLVAFNYHFIRFSDHVLSDLPFLFFSLWSFYQIQQQRFKTPIQAISLGFLLFFTYNIRDIGIALLPCLAIVQWQTYQQKKGKLLSLLLPYVCFILLGIMHAVLLPSVGNKHIHFLTETSFQTILNNGYYYWLLLGNYFMVFRGIPFFIQALVAGLFSIVISIGFLKTIKQQSPINFYVAFIMGVYLIWVSFQGMRFLFPIIPFLLFYLIRGISTLFSSQKTQQIIWIGLLLSSFAQSTYISAYYWKKDSNEAHSVELQRIYQFIQKELPKDALIVFQKPRALRLFSHRNAVQKPIKAAQYFLEQKTNVLPPKRELLFQTTHYQLLQKQL